MQKSLGREEANEETIVSHRSCRKGITYYRAYYNFTEYYRLCLCEIG